MAYVKYKELTKFFDFSRYIETKDLPWYVSDYIYGDERILSSYKTFRDHGVFTTKKIILFDNAISVRPFKEIYTIPYNSISSCSILYRPSKVELKFDLESGYQLRLIFVDMHKHEKARLRLLYSTICMFISNQEQSKDIINQLVENKIIVKED
ncbi:MAG: PH domain-containing protein [Tenericutes bacterium]|nr:PH domain-containing protein [Mycoplasmatota bacterium]